MRSLVILWALLFHWQLTHVIPDLPIHYEALATCHWYGDATTLAQTVKAGSKSCAWLMSGPYGRPGELGQMLDYAIQWLVHSSSTAMAGHT